uniref:Major capsid protein n=1 Tax=Microviridae sp. ctCoW18 TaxID=2826730 RepID=A0A8S5NPW2_9VIRU|nr:MAG TPA: Major capsid protein [Microviridae sp. ctCoW18]
MANIMSLATVKNNPSRSGFDLSRKLNFSAKVGIYYPIWHRRMIPSDSFDIDLAQFIRTQPLNTSAFARMKGYYDFYFVPLRVLWNKYYTALTQMNSNVQHASGPTLKDNVILSGELPYVTAEQLANYIESLSDSVDTFGRSRAWNTCILLEYLGYGNAFYNYISASVGGPGKSWDTDPLLINYAYDVSPLLCYQKVYADSGRFTQWERVNPSTFNLDYISGNDDLQLSLNVSGFTDSFNFLDLRYSNYQKDMFHGVIPQAQYGEASVAPLSGDIEVSATGEGVPIFKGNESTIVDGSPLSFKTLTGNLQGAVAANGNLTQALAWADPNLKLDAGINNLTLSVLALRRAEASQKWKEISLCTEEDYPSQIQAHFGQRVPKELSGMVRYLGGIDTSLDINEVTNTNLIDDNAATLGGKGSMSARGTIRVDANGEYGIVMCVFHALPMLDYVTSGVNPECLLTDATSYPIPEFDQIGMEQVPIGYLMNPLKSVFSSLSPTSYLGYAPRYFPFKTDYDRSVGAFSRSLQYWCLPFDDKAALAANSVDFPDNPNVESNSIKAGFFKVDPHCVDTLFAVKADDSPDTDQLLGSCMITCRAVRPLDLNGLPY